MSPRCAIQGCILFVRLRVRWHRARRNNIYNTEGGRISTEYKCGLGPEDGSDPGATRAKIRSRASRGKGPRKWLSYIVPPNSGNIPYCVAHCSSLFWLDAKTTFMYGKCRQDGHLTGCRTIAVINASGCNASPLFKASTTSGNERPNRRSCMRSPIWQEGSSDGSSVPFCTHFSTVRRFRLYAWLR